MMMMIIKICLTNFKSPPDILIRKRPRQTETSRDISILFRNGEFRREECAECIEADEEIAGSERRRHNSFWEV